MAVHTAQINGFSIQPNIGTHHLNLAKSDIIFDTVAPKHSPDFIAFRIFG